MEIIVEPAWKYRRGVIRLPKHRILIVDDHEVVRLGLSALVLPAPSLVRPVKIATVDLARILRRIGRFTAVCKQAFISTPCR